MYYFGFERLLFQIRAVEAAIKRSITISFSQYIYIYIYIYICVCVCMCVCVCVCCMWWVNCCHFRLLISCMLSASFRFCLLCSKVKSFGHCVENSFITFQSYILDASRRSSVIQLSSLPISGYFCIISAPTVTPAWLWNSQAASVIATCYARASTKAKTN